MNQINIDISKIIDIALKGVRRTAVFLGLGLNAVSRPEFKEYELINHSYIQLVPNGASDEEINCYKEHFSTWIVGCGLRELIETFSVFLDKVYEACTIMAISKKLISNSRLKENLKQFTFKGLRKKLDFLNEQFKIKLSNDKYLFSINQARNCLTHRMGIVGDEDCNYKNILEIKWKGIEIFADTKIGEIKFDLPLKQSISLEEGDQVKMRFCDRSLIIQKGQLIRLSAIDLSEICYFVLSCTKEIGNCTDQYAKRIGIISQS